MALSKIETGSLNFTPATKDGTKNLIINGAMQVWQRGTSVTGEATGGIKTADRWNFNRSGGTVSQSQQSVTLGDSVVGNFKYFLRSEFTIGDDNTGISQRIEDVWSVPEGSVTLSFYAKGTNPNSGHVIAKARQMFGTGGSPSADVLLQSQDVVLTSSWQRFVLTFTVPSLSGKVLGTNNDNFFEVYIQQPSDDDDASAWTLDITGVQLELGETATPFEHRSFGDELVRCQRYFEKTYDQGTAVATATATGSISFRPDQSGIAPAAYGQIPIRYVVTKRATATVTFYDTAGTSGHWTSAGAVDGARDVAATASYSTGFTPQMNQTYDLVSGHFTADAEL